MPSPVRCRMRYESGSLQETETHQPEKKDSSYLESSRNVGIDVIYSYRYYYSYSTTSTTRVHRVSKLNATHPPPPRYAYFPGDSESPTRFCAIRGKGLLGLGHSFSGFNSNDPSQAYRSAHWTAEAVPLCINHPVPLRSRGLGLNSIPCALALIYVLATLVHA